MTAITSSQHLKSQNVVISTNEADEEIPDEDIECLFGKIVSNLCSISSMIGIDSVPSILLNEHHHA